MVSELITAAHKPIAPENMKSNILWPRNASMKIPHNYDTYNYDSSNNEDDDDDKQLQIVIAIMKLLRLRMNLIPWICRPAFGAHETANNVLDSTSS